MEKLTAQKVIQLAGLEDERFYMQVDTGAIDTGKGWRETIVDADPDDMCFVDGAHLVEVVQDQNGTWIEA